MKTLGKFIADDTPKMNKMMMEGLTYHRLKNAVHYIDNFIRYSCEAKTNTHLRYLGYQELTPDEELKFLFNKTSKVIHDIAENDMYLVKFLFQYGEEAEVREYYFYIPFASKGNILKLSGNRFLVMPTLADKVISVGENTIFINILTAKYNFNREYHPITINGVNTNIPVVNSELYKNQSKKLEDTTKAKTTIIHYLLANYGYTKTMEMLLGFVPEPCYESSVDGHVVIGPTGATPKGFIGIDDVYVKTDLRFKIPDNLYTKDVSYCVGNVFYVIDNFPDRVNMNNLDDTVMWRRLLGEIIHSGNHGVAYLHEKMYAHFNDLNSQFDTITVEKLKDVKVKAESLMDLLGVIFSKFNEWIMSEGSRSLYYNKSYEVESFVLNTLTFRITRIVLDINKEELRAQGAPLDKQVVDKIFKAHFTARAIFFIKKDKTFITSIEYSGDHLYFKKSAMVSRQESDSVNVKKGENNTSERGNIVASVATVGSLLSLSKTNPTALIRLNPYVNVDPLTGTVLPHPEFDEIIAETDRKLANIEFNDLISDMGDTNDDDLVGDYDDDNSDDNDFDDSESGNEGWRED